MPTYNFFFLEKKDTFAFSNQEFYASFQSNPQLDQYTI